MRFTFIEASQQPGLCGVAEPVSVQSYEGHHSSKSNVHMLPLHLDLPLSSPFMISNAIAL